LIVAPDEILDCFEIGEIVMMKIARIP